MTLLNFDVTDELKDRIDSISNSMGISKTALLTFGIVFVIFLANSNTLPQIQSLALAKGVNLEQAFQQFLYQHITIKKGTEFQKDKIKR